MFSYEGREWDVVTEAAKDMITQMLVMDIGKRVAAKPLLQHRWFQVRFVCRPTDVHTSELCMLVMMRLILHHVGEGMHQA